jgi:hypothetical protein
MPEGVPRESVTLTLRGTRRHAAPLTGSRDIHEMDIALRPCLTAIRPRQTLGASVSRSLRTSRCAIKLDGCGWLLGVCLDAGHLECFTRLLSLFY